MGVAVIPPLSLLKLLAIDDLIGGTLFKNDTPKLWEDSLARVTSYFTTDLDGMV